MDFSVISISLSTSDLLLHWIATIAGIVYFNSYMFYISYDLVQSSFSFSASPDAK